MQPPFTQEYLKTILRYEPETGYFFWLVAKSRNVKVGDRAGQSQGNNYWHVMIDNVHYYSSALALFYVTGEWPERVDHADRDQSNDKYNNLRPCNRGQNRHNAKVNSNSESGAKGVRYRKDAMKWQARIQVNGRPISLGHFKTKEEAIAAYEEGARKYYGEFASTRDGVGEGAPPPPPVWIKTSLPPKKETTLEDIFGKRN